MFKREPASSAPPGTIDFELTDIAEARAAHDVLPPGIEQFERRQNPKLWQERRRRLLATDRALTGRSLEWVMRLPTALRPLALIDHFPRIVNSLSASWDDIEESLSVFDHLLNDRRIARRGFPAGVRLEIEALCEHRVELG
jgi:hypothetical protein